MEDSIGKEFYWKSFFFRSKPREKNLISLETSAETKESGMKLKSGQAGSRVTENPEIGRKKREGGREIRES